MKAWHFLQENGRLQWRCGRIWKPKVGQTLTVDPDKLDPCFFGLHASAKIMDALKYAPGPLICRVELGGKIIEEDDKVVASERTIIAMADATNVLHAFACWSAEQALKNIESPDPRSIAAIEAKRKWLRGDISDAELKAAYLAARSAAYLAARSAAESEARLAAESAAYSAARSAAHSAARSAAYLAARSAAYLAARSAQNHKLTRMVNKLFKEES